MIAGEDEHVLELLVAQDVEILEHGIGRALVPALLDALLRRQQVDELLELTVQEAPSALQMLDEAVRLVLRDHADAAYPGVDAIGEREIDDAELAAERDRGLGAPVGELHQPAAPATGEHHGERVLGEAADETRIGLLGLLPPSVVHDRTLVRVVRHSAVLPMAL